METPRSAPRAHGPARAWRLRGRPSPQRAPAPRPSLPAAAAACSRHDAQARRPPRALRRRPPEAPRPRPAARPPTRGLGRTPAASGWRQEPGAGGGGRDGAAPLRASGAAGGRSGGAPATASRKRRAHAPQLRVGGRRDVSRREASRRPRRLERPGAGCGAAARLARPRLRAVGTGGAAGRRGVPERAGDCALRRVWGAGGEHSGGRRGRSRARK